MDVKTIVRYQRIAPRKMRLIADLVRKKNVFQAQKELEFCNKRGSTIMKKILNTAIANAKNNFHISDQELEKFFIKEIKIDEGPKLKRWRPVSRGAAHPIEKKTSHITMIISDLKEKEEEKIEGKKDLKLKNLDKKRRLSLKKGR